MLDALKTWRGLLRKLCIMFYVLFTHGRPVGLIRLLLVFQTFFLVSLLPPRLPLVYVLCTMGYAPSAFL
jgi:hypothetical protein